MGNCNPRALFAFACVSSLAAEACFLTLLFLEAKVGKNNSSSSCWTNFQSGSVKENVGCPYFVLFLASIVNGLLLLYTASFLIARLLGSRECTLERIPVCRVLLRYGSFFTNLLTTLLIAILIGLLIGFKSKKKYSGGIFLRHRHVYFVVLCAGFIWVLIATLTSGLLAYQRRPRRMGDDFEDIFDRSYSDHSTGHFGDINWGLVSCSRWIEAAET